jgi:hypothetical protein
VRADGDIGRSSEEEAPKRASPSES